ncbi:MAG TPA: SMC-Scp complex subunit ScpB [Syntrophothermus lipocalidus]|uniref:Segregation and condensation protein B n=1 Tax=Syntrophothermus lipocalidus (strain DSM 12680 / TGB-C1) TaxID=643648 RepID=D7CKT9_SYNLT|nr:SMC-Scp complex subunit ScpB [Syntrophothermus lipocalidus]ADI01324.1 chromosome segregation and condensation protein, ScpB [Syntrophothermus lipocalidus DSM 12680]HHV76316.1 SMC-Scp complex subunit ScpB [Syntrophothermus lipocalidus]HOV43430.1 SMC-Scp complex subunit ScpB [Syntrophothermus lipocalidus]
MLARISAKATIEALLFASGDPLPLSEIARVTGLLPDDVEVILEELILEYNKEEHGIQVVKSDAGYAMCTKPAFFEYIRDLNRGPEKRLSQAALETLAIIAYRQPVTRTEIEAIRGVKAERVINSLLERGLIAEAGRKDAPGRPVLYVTTNEFMRLFGLASLEDLPKDVRGA